MDSIKKIGIIFPHQLFEVDTHPLLQHSLDELWVIEDSLFFGDKHTKIYFHPNKLVLHRASMKSFVSCLPAFWQAKLRYFEYNDSQSIDELLRNHQVQSLAVVDPVDYLLTRRIKRAVQNVTILPTSNFMLGPGELKQYQGRTKTYRLEYFYRWHRTLKDILMDGDQPIGGQWNFDHDNRKKIPSAQASKVPFAPSQNNCPAVKEAIAYVNTIKNQAYHCNSAVFWYPVDHNQAQQWLAEFFKSRFTLFGDYEDAMLEGRHQLYHSCLSALINIGLLDPARVVQQAISYAHKNNVPINSLEGFVRQIVGWREYMRFTYEKLGTAMRLSNQWQHTRKLKPCWWEATTGLLPVDDVINKVTKTGYAHHIERLMIIGNVMFLCQVDPKQVYQWFMSLFIDAYDWVMVTNVYAMSQFSFDSSITTKPYVSGSNYVRKMSNYPKGDWAHQWDALY